MEPKTTQLTSWGKIDWLVQPAAGERVAMSIGLLHYEPGKTTAGHIHFSDEQFLYTISGEGENVVNGKSSFIKKGDFIYLPPGIMHATKTIGSEPLIQILVSCPVRLNDQLAEQLTTSFLVERIKEYSITSEIIENYVIGIVADLEESIFSNINIPITFFTSTFKPLIYGKLSQVCQEKCGVDISQGICPMGFDYIRSQNDKNEECSAVLCPHGLTFLFRTIILEDRVIGYLQGGYYDNSTDMPYATVDGLYEIFSEISRSIRVSCAEKLLQHNLNVKQDEIKAETSKSVALSQTLVQAQSRILNIQIKNHFLFNTLNSISSLALRDNSPDTYHAILDLSALLRGLLHRTGTLVTIAIEMENIEKYINLQRLRFEHPIRVIFERDPLCENAIIPFHLLQPIVENCFVHGFKGKKAKNILTITTKRDDDSAVIEISDNGCGMNEEILNSLRKFQDNQVSHGTDMVYQTLYNTFGKHCSINVQSKEGEGTQYQIKLPYSISDKVKEESQFSSIN